MPTVQIISDLNKMTDFGLFDLDDVTFNELFTDNKDVIFFKDIGRRNWF
ncbi:hypothetical protein PP175_06520 [Aneurinibacillus sp. Ricciae_BoGa-3]|nr:hypothetical protein [Aneurinibacillus sp. Ricciae_BoGa-3]WCK55594.1 hypothetical protein PP175_06520 [Aneurinibacillus sp. Ricciae_BoGa-3]